MSTQLVISQITFIYNILFYFWTDFEELGKAYEKSKKVIEKEKQIPRFFLRCLVELEDFVSEVCISSNYCSLSTVFITNRSLCDVSYYIVYHIFFLFKVWIADMCTVHMYFHVIHKYCSHVYFGNSVGRTEKEENKWARIMRKD